MYIETTLAVATRSDTLFQLDMCTGIRRYWGVGKRIRSDEQLGHRLRFVPSPR